MRINKFVASATGLSRRSADAAIETHRVLVNDKAPDIGMQIHSDDIVTLDGNSIKIPIQFTIILLNKPVGFVCSRNGQGSKTIYDLLPEKMHSLKPVGRLDKDSSGLLVLTDDGDLANQLSHPRHNKLKTYTVLLNKALKPMHKQKIISSGIKLSDGNSILALKSLGPTGQEWQVSMHEGRNRQIRRTFEVLGYSVTKLHRETFGPYRLGKLNEGDYQKVEL